MKLEFVQTEKTSLTALFNIVFQGRIVGWASFESFIESGQGVWRGMLGNTPFEVSYARSHIAGIGIDEDRPYNIAIGGMDAGNVWREGSSVAQGTKLLAVRTNIEGRNLDMYPFARGRKGYRYPIFDGQVQIAEISKECKVKNDLHAFEIAIANRNDDIAAVVLCCYVFSQSWWHPGPARKHDTHLYIQKATRPGTDYYDEGFFERALVLPSS